MATPFLGEVRAVAFNFAPQGWALCNGQILPINQNQALFSLLGTTYGGDGRTTFALPNLQSRVSLHFGQGAGLSSYNLGQQAGEENHTLVPGEMPAHAHTLQADSALGTASAPTAHHLAQSPLGLGNTYAPATPDTALAGNALTAAGGGQPHENRQPFLTINFIIALQGIFPARA